MGTTITNRITKTPNVCGGDACIRGHRIPVCVLVGYRLQGADDAELLTYYPTLKLADLAAAWAYYDGNREEIDQAIRENATGEESQAD